MTTEKKKTKKMKKTTPAAAAPGFHKDGELAAMVGTVGARVGELERRLGDLEKMSGSNTEQELIEDELLADRVAKLEKDFMELVRAGKLAAEAGVLNSKEIARLSAGDNAAANAATREALRSEIRTVVQQELASAPDKPYERLRATLEELAAPPIGAASAATATTNEVNREALRGLMRDIARDEIAERERALRNENTRHRYAVKPA
jgi:hypothetical protein